MTQRSILITGSASGIGRDAATTLVAHGWQVFAAVRAPADVATVPEGCTGLHLDYADTTSISAALDQVLTATGLGEPLR